MKQDGSTLDPTMSAQGEMMNTAWSAIYEPLVYADNSYTLHPNLAVNWTEVDSLTYDFNLRQGVTYQDGTQFNATTVKFGFDRALSPGIVKSDAFFISSVEVLSQYKVRFHLNPNGDFANFMFDMAKVPLGYMGSVSMTAILKEGNQTFGRNPVGTGPYQVVDWVDQDHLTLKANPHYWGGVPPIENVIIKVIPDPSVRALELESGQIQLSDILPQYISVINSSGTALVKISAPEKDIVMSINVRNGNPLLLQNNTKAYLLREAISYAVDRQSLVQAIMDGYATPASSIVLPQQTPYYNQSILSFGPTANVTKAKQLLAEAGYPNGFTFTVWTSGQFVNSLQIATLMQQQLAKAGITMQIHDDEFGVLITDLFSGNYEAMIHDNGGGSPLESLFKGYNSECSLPACFGDIPNANDSTVNYLTNQMNQAVSNGSTSLAIQLSHEAQQYLNNQSYVVYLYYVPLINGYSKNVIGYQIMNTGTLEYEGDGGFILYRPALNISVSLVASSHSSSPSIVPLLFAMQTIGLSSLAWVALVVVAYIVASRRMVVSYPRA